MRSNMTLTSFDVPIQMWLIHEDRGMQSVFVIQSVRAVPPLFLTVGTPLTHTNSICLSASVETPLEIRTFVG